MNEEHPISKLREKLAKLKGPLFWRSLDEAAETDEFKSFLKEEYPHGPALSDTPSDRREFLKLMGASLVMAGLAGCKPQDLEKIVPYVQAPEDVTPGKPIFFATAMPFNGASTGLLVESHLGRPTKVEGNPQHPDSLGATSLFHQASILGLYDPDRSKAIRNGDSLSTWQAFTADLADDLGKLKSAEGEGVYLLTEPVTSPSLAAQIQAFLKHYPKAVWYQHESVNRDNERAGIQRAAGQDASLIYDFTQADVIVSFDSDFMTDLPGSLRYAREFSLRRQVIAGTGLDKKAAALPMNRFYQIEPTPTTTGSKADHRLARKASEVSAFAAALAAELGVSVPGGLTAKLSEKDTVLVKSMAADLKAAASKSLILTGQSQPAAVHALVLAMNEKLGSLGKTVTLIDAIDVKPALASEDLKSLTADLEAGKVKLLAVLGVNPVYDAPADLQFSKKYLLAERRIHLGLYDDETSLLSHWHIPQAHFLEVFSDGRASDGTLSFSQPLIAPLYEGKSLSEVLAAMLDEPAAKNYELVRGFWKEHPWTEGDFDKAWRRALHEGLVAGSAFKPKALSVKTAFSENDLKGIFPEAAQGLEINFRPDPTVWDGRFSNYGWLQELPKPITTLTWDNSLQISPATAEKLSLKNEDMAVLEIGGRFVQGPIWINPGQAEGTVTVHLGYGRSRAGKTGSGLGFDASAIRRSDALHSIAGAKLTGIGTRHRLAATQLHHSMEGRAFVRHATLDEFQKHPDFAHHHAHGPAHTSLYPKHPQKGDYAWGMAVNLNACTGCNACVAACQSENNIPVVGKHEVLMGREMHWIRIDRYYEGGTEEPEIHHQPVMCMHCENAPCEPVCPFGATGHSDEGLNEMTYNRCGGTKYCANNCPYKVRRFNFLEYTERNSETLKMQRNPDVTVRVRGVMEKCTFCVQRINHARIDAKVEGRKIGDGDVRTACQSACPTNAIVFGDILDPESQVSKLKAAPLNYGILTELNTFPRLTYLAKVSNPNPNLIEKASHGHHA